ncbi:MAG: chaperone modulator CbpM [Methylococcaceae bacterium]|jgi:chaperone modulatory protein CbpM|nr:chaperone modulator CbpM [Methylococcaceae bacterium]MDD1631583.1 chaperone modulator CbpM [Methylococcaceae bacterium]MDD1643879.1 chaperone modulator CbpM [Methylococcaceae bacterium]OYV17637.1 MAG: MerR family transcriptional regulator [Methylococcaceae bacterium NSM2-1]
MNSHDLLLVHTGTVIEEDSLTLAQLCRACGVHADWIISLVEESIIEPQGEDIRLWRFSGASLVRARSALRLQRDLGVNLAGIALALDLIEELESLRAHMKTQGH